ncbi:MAG: Fe-S protein assembly co-chaperone HscB [Myxococcales bacterium]|nr:Fe-S protein assembly co-chaperone HscB [Myxococcales bacterium]
MDANNHFAVLGLEPAYELDVGALERSYLALQQQHHPDHATGGSVGERRAAMELSGAINEAYRVLRDPVRRAEYLCRLGGIDIDVSDPERGAPPMPQAFLIDMIERRDALADTRRRGPAAIDALRDRVEREQDEAFDRAVVALRRGAVREAAVALVERRYLQRLVDELDHEA